MNPLTSGASIDVNDAVAVAPDATDARRRSRRRENPAFGHSGHPDICRLTPPVQRARAVGAGAVTGCHKRPLSGLGCNMRQYALQARREAARHDGSRLDCIGYGYAVGGKPDLAPLAIPGFAAGEKGQGEQAGNSDRENVTHSNPPWQMPCGKLISDAACKRRRPAARLGAWRVKRPR